jgi:hypothetical protein
MNNAADIQFGAEAYQKTGLPPSTVPNMKSAYILEEYLTDKIASWIESGFVVSPFHTPSMQGFHGNPLLAVSRNDSIRPIINLSEPKSSYLKKNVYECKIEKI